MGYSGHPTCRGEHAASPRDGCSRLPPALTRGRSAHGAALSARDPSPSAERRRRAGERGFPSPPGGSEPTPHRLRSRPPPPPQGRCRSPAASGPVPGSPHGEVPVSHPSTESRGCGGCREPRLGPQLLGSNPPIPPPEGGDVPASKTWGRGGGMGAPAPFVERAQPRIGAAGGRLQPPRARAALWGGSGRILLVPSPVMLFSLGLRSPAAGKQAGG